jgi:hypothetical protein
MAHVEIKQDRIGTTQVVIDGVDVSRAILREGFSVQPSNDGTWLVTLSVRADRLTADLPDAVIAAALETEAERVES